MPYTVCTYREKSPFFSPAFVDIILSSQYQCLQSNSIPHSGLPPQWHSRMLYIPVPCCFHSRFSPLFLFFSVLVSHNFIYFYICFSFFDLVQTIFYLEPIKIYLLVSLSLFTPLSSQDAEYVESFELFSHLSSFSTATYLAKQTFNRRKQLKYSYYNCFF